MRLALRAHRLLLALALLWLGLYALVFLAYTHNLLQFPFDYDQGEGFELVDTILLAEGRSPWRDAEVWPFYASNYPPLYHLAAVPCVTLFGPRLACGRALGALVTLGAAASVAWAVWHEGRRPAIAALAGLAFLASNSVYHIGPLFRQHMSMVFLETLAIVVLARAAEQMETGAGRRGLLTGLLLLLAAGYTKQLALVTALAALAFLFLRNPRRGLSGAALLALAGGGLFLALELATGGQWSLQIISANINTFYPQQALDLFRLWFGLHGFLILPALLLLLHELYFGRLSLYSLWFVAATAGGILAGKWGAGDSYFTTAIAATCIMSGRCALRALDGDWRAMPGSSGTRLRRQMARHKHRLRLTALLLIPLLYLGYARATLHLPTREWPFSLVAEALAIRANARNGLHDAARRDDGNFAAGYADIGHFTTAEDIAAGQRIVEILRAAEGPVLAEEATFSILAGIEVVSNPTQLRNLDANGLWQGEALLAMIRAREFSLVLLRAGFYPGTVLEAIGEHYAGWQNVSMNGFDYQLLRPRAGPVAP